MVESSRLVYRSNTNKVISIAGWAVLGLAVVAAFLAGRPSAVLGLVPIATIALLIWELFWRPAIIVEDDGVTLVNQFHTVVIPWAKIVDVDTKWSMTIVTPERRYRGSAAPAPGAMYRPNLSGAARTGRVVDGSISKADAPGTDSGDAATIVRRRLHAMADAGTLPIGQAESVSVTTRVHWMSIAVLAALLVASIPALLRA
ncbi:PH domain-containing protein [Microbacterium rhizosphaerae]|uniref:PH domain-containing protein n=1 Tax=Microbacterium rhizosphaerae TaxID=1678237 RepID=A0ABZ0SH06_9MICO|nr:PH domain-containing protein [Microbacterium rhizosphaerae]WPR88467.1 PH domain-containing protein [Microbacterium rhizosphaerae]